MSLKWSNFQSGLFAASHLLLQSVCHVTEVKQLTVWEYSVLLTFNFFFFLNLSPSYQRWWPRQTVIIEPDRQQQLSKTTKLIICLFHF